MHYMNKPQKSMFTGIYPVNHNMAPIRTTADGLYKPLINPHYRGEAYLSVYPVHNKCDLRVYSSGSLQSRINSQHSMSIQFMYMKWRSHYRGR